MVDVTHRDGVAWFDAPIPRRWHRCSPQTKGWHNLTLVLRCACGAIGGYEYGRLVWDERNSRRKDVTR